jgi:hypothetical protein
MKIRTTTAALTAAVLTLGLAACGGDDESGGGDLSPLAQAIADDMLDTSEEGGMVPTVDEANCFAGSVVDGIGEDRLRELGVDESTVQDIEELDFSAEEVDVVVDSMFDCVDVSSMMASELEADFGAEGAQCVADKLDAEFLKDIMAQEFAGVEAEMSDEFFQAFLDIASECDLPLN